MPEDLRLYTYWRSSAAWRVRIGLNLKGLDYAPVPVHLLRDGGRQHAPDYVRLNPQEQVPTLLHGGRVLRQSLAILEYLDECWPAPPLLPAGADERARVRALAQMVACDIHPLGNLRVRQYLEHALQLPAETGQRWSIHWVRNGLEAMETLLRGDRPAGTFCGGDRPGLADCCLVPQLYNARRLGLEVGQWPTLERIERACQALEAFAAAAPDRQPDAEA